MRMLSMPALWIALLLTVACSDQVTQPPEPVASVVVQPEALTLRIGESHRLSALARDRDGRILEGRSVEWTTENDAVAGVSEVGEAIARREGVARLWASVEGKVAEATVTVLPVVVPVARVVIEPAGDQTLEVGSSLQLTAVAYAENDSVLGDRTVTWASSHSGVAATSASGRVQALTPGTARITAAVEGVEAHSTVTVTPAAGTRVIRVDMDPTSLVLGTGEARTITATPRGAGDIVLSRPLAWLSSNPDVATVDATGRITATGTGDAVITAVAEGVEGQTTLRVVSWSERPLQSVGDSVLPSTLFTRTYTDAGGVARIERIVAREGRFRMIETGLHAGRYEQGFDVTIIRDGQVAELGQLVYAGTWHHDIVGDSYTLYPWSGSSLTARTLPDGTLRITGALEANTRQLTLSYRTP